MSEKPSQPEFFRPLRRVAFRLGVPTAWLRAEAEAGRVPHLRVGRRLLLNLEAVERALLRRTQHSAAKGGHHE